MTRTEGNSFLGLKYIDISTDDTVAAAATDDIEITPPKGLIYVIAGVEVSIPDPAGSASGNHSLYVYNKFFSVDSTYFDLKSNAGGAIYIQNDTGLIADTENPGAGSDQFKAILGERSIVNNDYPLVVRYSNQTDVSQTGTRTVKIMFKVYKELL